MLTKLLLVAMLAVGSFANMYKLKEEDKERFRTAIGNTCEDNGAGDKKEQAVAALEPFFVCFHDIVDVVAVELEIKAAKSADTLNNVFKKYCDKAPELKGCVSSFFDAVYPCLPASSRDHLAADKEATGNFGDYLCNDNAKNLVSYITDGSRDCFNERDGYIGECVNKLREGIDVEEEQKHLSVKAFCNRLVSFSTCAAQNMELCTSPTHNKLMDEFNKYLSNSTPCRDWVNIKLYYYAAYITRPSSGPQLGSSTLLKRSLWGGAHAQAPKGLENTVVYVKYIMLVAL
ncbi:unnamed protein product [Leptosia nina]|uniref:Uncharacterized protein n=1 Tax=Leptosia nina TaxID=320188 RepID=A0AAV1JVV0_9NEOP